MMTAKSMALVAAALCGGVALAQSKDAFMRQQAFAEMQRVTGQMDVLQSNFNDLQSRVGRLEGGGDTRGLRHEIDALKAQIADLRREMQNQRDSIVRDLTARISKMQQLTAAQERKAPPPKPAYTGPCQEYVVKNGDSLYVIALAFNTSVEKVCSMNNLKKGANLRVGQKLLVPKVKD